MDLRRVHRLSSALLLLLATTSPLQAADPWPPVDPGELASKTPTVDPNADAEGLLWDVRVSADSAQGFTKAATTFEHYLRVKIFTERGRETQSQIALPYRDHQSRIDNISARTIGPDGTIKELQSRDIFDRSIVEQNGFKVKAKSFALPAVVVGAIVEYRWKETRENTLSTFLPLPLQRDLPMRVVRYHIRPIALPGAEPRSQVFNVAASALKSAQEKDGFTTLEVQNMRAARQEPYTPPELNVLAWTLLFYRDRNSGGANETETEFWSRYGKAVYEANKPYIRTTDPVTKLASETTKGLSTPEDKIAALVTLVRQRVRRIDVDTVSEAERRSWKGSKNADDTLKQGMGTGENVTELFVAMATSVGLEARLALAPDRTLSFGQPAMRQPNFLRRILAAVKVGAAWRFLDLGSEHASLGHTGWEQEGTQALLLDPEAPAFAVVPPAAAERALRRRIGTLKLTSSGSLDGDLRFEYTGHWATQFRERDDTESPAEIAAFYRDELSTLIPGSIVSDVVTEHLTEPEQPYVVRLKLSVPAYAQVTGARLFVQPSLMTRGSQNSFSAATRQQPIHFPFAYSEEDAITIELPQGFEIEPGTAPPLLGIDNGATARYIAAVKTSTDNRQLVYTRAMTFGSGSRIFFPASSYAAIKGFFDSVHTADSHTVVLRRSAGGPQQ